jgi:mannose/fructose/N-acetylgalactosamine-specific phosphotransferase system component IID
LLVGLATLIANVIGSALIYAFEHGANGSEIANVGDAIFWTSCQLLTVSSQMQVPLSTGGRVVDVFLELYAITVVTTLAGSWGAFFHHQTRQRWGDPPLSGDPQRSS